MNFYKLPLQLITACRTMPASGLIGKESCSKPVLSVSFHFSLTQFKLIFIFLLSVLELNVFSTVKMSNLFTNSMVLQRNTKVKIWGTATDGEQVTVSISNQTKNTVTQGGSWSVIFDPMNAGGPYTMTVKGTNTITITNVYVGEVWQCAGQSNMDTRVNYYPHYKSLMNSADLSMLRYYTLRQAGGVTNTVWESCNAPDKIGKLSCLGFFFGKEILSALENKIAVGLIVTAVGGTTISSWIDPKTLSDNPSIATIDNTAGSMYDSWVKPVTGFSIRGTLWMHGEQDRSSGLNKYYHERLTQLINGWRSAWNIGDFPFYIVQLANYGTSQTDPNESAGSAVIREAQRLGLTLPNTELVVIIDIGDSLHFGNKQEAGRRLALPARALEYGENNLVYSGPLFVEKTIEGAKIHCRFVRCGSEMKSKSGTKLTGFAIAGLNNKFTWADAIINGNTITVSSPAVTNPINVRYAFGGNPIGNLINAEGLPASPFTTEGEQLPPGKFEDNTNTKFITHNLIPPSVFTIKNGILTLHHPHNSSFFKIDLLSLNGEAIITRSFNYTDNTKASDIPLYNLNSGCYILRYSYANFVHLFKLNHLR